MRKHLLLALLALLAACDQPEMRDQPKYEAYERAETLPGGNAEMLPPAGTVARGDTVEARAPRPALNAEMLERGRDLFDAVCAPCHSPLGDGQGMVVLRGFPAPPSFHTARLRETPDAHIYDVITGGFGIMYAYRNRVRPRDRWAIVEYIRALQLSQHAEAGELPEALRRDLAARGGDE